MRKIGVVTTSRADYGIYRSILRGIRASAKLELYLFVTGMHLAPEYGRTIDHIKQDGWEIAAQVDALLSDSPGDIARAMGKTTMGFAQVLEDCPVDVLLVLGDRFEMHAAAVAAIPFGIPLAHIHGGELTYGAIDEYYRHSLTKLSDVHFASTTEYGNRIKQLGEPADRVFVVGAPALDNIADAGVCSAQELQDKYAIDFSRSVLLVTFHPVTRELAHTQAYIENLLKAVQDYSQCSIVFTPSNADPGNRVIMSAIRDFLAGHGNARLAENFRPEEYLFMMRTARAMVGNSSSGIIEAASFALPVVNIGTRQDGRVRAVNVLDVGYDAGAIRDGIRTALSDSFRASLAGIRNPYGDGRAGGRIVQVLEDIELARPGYKTFYDIPLRELT